MFRRIAIYSASLYGVTLLSSGLSFIVTMIVARRIPKEALGLYGFYVTVYSLLGMLLCSGLNQALVKMLGQKGGDKDEYRRLVLAIIALTALIAWPAAALSHFLGSVSYAWGFAALPFFALNLLVATIYRAEFRRGQEVALRFSISVLNSTLTLAFVFLTSNPELAPIRGDFLSMALPSVLIGAFLWRASGATSGKIARSLRGACARRMLSFALPLTIAGMAFTVYSNSSSILIRAIVGLAALGEYFFALQLMMILDKPMQILSSVILAAFAQNPDISPQEHRRLMTFNLAVFPLLAAAVVYGAPLLLALGDLALAGVGGEPLVQKYERAPLYVALFAIAVPARCVEFLVSTLAIARGQPAVHRNSHVLTTSLALPLLAALVYRFGAWGAAVMPLAYQTIFLALQTRQLRGIMPEILAQSNRAAIVGTVLLGLMLIAGGLPGAIWFFPFAAGGYLALGHVLGGWDLRLLIPGSWRPELRSEP